MVKLLFVRHGQSISNKQNLFTGQKDADLSPIGFRQAQITKDFILKNYKIDSIYSSDLLRAYHTIEPVACALNLPVHKMKELREICGGEWEEQTFDYIQEHYSKDFNIWHTNIGLCRCTGGENMHDVQIRGMKAVKQIIKDNEGKTVLIGTHAGFIRAMQCIWQNIPLQEMKNTTWVTNASVSEVVYDNDKIVSLNMDISKHLEGFVTKLPKGV